MVSYLRASYPSISPGVMALNNKKASNSDYTRIHTYTVRYTPMTSYDVVWDMTLTNPDGGTAAKSMGRVSSTIIPQKARPLGTGYIHTERERERER